ncbi:phosphoribosylformylglycinamidine cyclo-ligase [Tuwongella immobilis]|uniref:Phosphoribosylformylglycinamidine cyclo-ligase n=1 Tax=Tuwongella immobilis TaxID=692036 RepID=A0A6C2YUC5_9BACT|nr:phosphoribosylformylglycinamidine cyclo-ligase [Tuwongella immobilis]VIP04639.1 phosphoribosylaminoimidazole synthetase : Phosphoribosylformylglycinamidine cyclo-ligase OS=Singulisphaera acidiphila (strain ATCC BAA-1392 / DSM 18658 / VKM B-2454 / MOB10) GN=purM PE=3 SV=1: AIRS: AIRS_C [Tuwongella immobilis]VTS06639.1 phosphoribosylaminoimidazole synthetase : Phosphoribosylformylglycinamidine cyclo-ligase OS=Singulisphaera acidiphila (strain ATCC BAA-1392 / DSM 18658 / VKM B-2454 / MOB10) GN=pu
MSEITYRDAGLNLDTYEETLEGIRPLMLRTQDRTRVLDGFGGFASLFDLDPNRWLFNRKYRKPVLVTCTDGVGTKLKIATMMDRYETVGIDLVAMSVNDALCTGAEPLVFLDYLAMPKDDPTLTKRLMVGMSEGCMQAQCSLTGGETAILPDFYAPGDFDMAGFCVGVVDKDRIIDGKQIQVGDAVIGLESSGIHSNGYSLVRKLAFDIAKLGVHDRVPELSQTVGETLLTPTRIYVQAVHAILRNYPVKKRVVRGLAHITGGGLVDNVPRILPPGRRVFLKRGSWPIPPVFTWLQGIGNVPQAEMDRVFNMGIGFVMVVAPYFAESIIRQLAAEGVPAHLIGEVREGEPAVEWVS